MGATSPCKTRWPHNVIWAGSSVGIATIGWTVRGRILTKSWEVLRAKIRTQTQEAYHRALNLEHRIRHVNSFFLDRAWFTMQIFPPPTDFVRQMNIAISWFLWKGAVFRVPLSTLLRPKELGGRALTHITAKCMTLFMLRMEKQGQRIDTFTEKWLTQWRLHRRTPNPPLIKRIPTKFDYLSIQRRIGICADEKNPWTPENL